jgi:hypothetical protein
MVATSREKIAGLSLDTTGHGKDDSHPVDAHAPPSSSHEGGHSDNIKGYTTEDNDDYAIPIYSKSHLPSYPSSCKL